MKYRFCLALGLLVTLSLSAGQPAPQPASAALPGPAVFQDPDLAWVFDLAALPVVQLQVSSNEWNKLLDAFDQDEKTQTVIKAGFRFAKGGKTEVLPEVGLRLRGNTSRIRPQEGTSWNPAHFQVKFAAFAPKTRFHGLENLILKSFVGAPTFSHEIYGYDLLRRFGVWLAPRATYARLELAVAGEPKPVYLGIYRLVEAIDQVFLKKRFGPQADGWLWKCTNKGGKAAPLTPSSLTGRLGVADDTTEYPYDLKTGTKTLAAAQTALKDWVVALSTTPQESRAAWLDSHLAADQFVRYLAVSVAVGNFDDYWLLANNYFFYLDKAGKGWFIPYDFDNILGTSVVVGDTGTQDPWRWGGSDGRPLVNRLLLVDSWKSRYKDCLTELLDPTRDLFDAAASARRLQTWHRLIEPFVANDAEAAQRIFDAPADWSQHHDYVLWTKASGKRNFFEVRAAALRAALVI